MSDQLAYNYREEVRTQRANCGNGAPTDAPEVVRRLVRLRRRTGTLTGTNRTHDKEVLEKLEAVLPQHITTEADRVITTVTQEVRDVGKSVAALHCDLTAFVRGEVTLDDSMSLEQQKVAADLQQAVLIARKRTITATMKEEKATAKAVTKAAAKAAAKPRAKGRAHD